MSPTAESRRRQADNIAIGLLTFGLALLLAISAWWVSTELGRARALREDIHANYQQLIEIQRVFSLIQDAETGTRGYAISGREEFLAPYTRAVTHLPAATA